jgi:hypothetical protein
MEGINFLLRQNKTPQNTRQLMPREQTLGSIIFEILLTIIIIINIKGWAI